MNRFTFSILFTFTFSALIGQQIKFENYTTDDGLSNNSVIDIENDEDGGLWIGTLDGLNYFDGHTITYYKHEINEQGTIPGNYIINLERDKNGNLWLITKEGHVSRYLGNSTFENFKFDKAPRQLKLAADGTLYVFAANTAYKFENGKFIVATYTPPEKENYENLKQILLTEYPGLIINDVLKDNIGNIWFATRRNGLFILPNDINNINNKRIDHYTYDVYTPYSFNSNEIEKLHQDLFGNVWLAQKDGGLSMAYNGSDKITTIVPHPVNYPHLPNETLRAITKDSKSNLWLGYYTNGIYYYDTETKCYLKYKVKEAKQNSDWERVRNLFTASDGTVWVGTYAGILRITDKGYKTYEADSISELPNNRNYSMFEDTEKRLWIACWGGLAKFNLNENHFDFFKGQNQFDPFNIRSITKSGDVICMGTEENGVLFFDIKTGMVEQLTKNEGILGNSIYSIYKEELTTTYWIASLGGISVYNKATKEIKNITEEEGLPSHMVYGLLKNKDQIWASTTKGIALIDTNSFEVKAFNPKEGWQAPEFSEGAYYQDSKGLMFFGGVNGLNYFNPNTIVNKTVAAKIKVVVNGDENFKKNIENNFRDNSLEITVTPIKFPNTSDADIYYKLSGKDEDWNLLPKDHLIKYANLSSGEYTFYVKEGNTQNLEVVSFNLKIKKAFYETIYFYVLLLFILLIGAFLIIYFKSKNALAQQKKLENQISARTRVIENQKRDLVAVNTLLDDKNKEIVLQKEKLLAIHNNLKNEAFEIEKFKTFVLSEFQEPISRVMKLASELKEDTKIQKEILWEAGKLVNLVSEWNYLDHVKEIGDIKVAAINLPILLKASIDKLKVKLKSNKVNFKGEYENSLGWVAVDVLRLRLLLQYLFNDLAKYSDTSSTLGLKIVRHHTFLEFRIESNSSVLISNWFNILHYSPYFIAVQNILKDLDGTFKETLLEGFHIALKIPVEFINANHHQVENITWKYLDQQKDVQLGKKQLLVFSDEVNFSVANQILENENYQLVFENEVNNFTSAINHMNIDLIVFYQATFSKELVQYLKSSLGNTSSKRQIPMVYISEDINYELQEQSVEFGIDVVIQLPTSTRFILKKISSLLERRDDRIEHKLQQEVFQILTDDDINSPNDKLLKNSLTIIKQELSNPSFNVEMLVEKLGISRVKCYRIYKELLEQSPSDVITSLRLQKAEALLKTNKFNISEISFECGYNDPKYFGRSFKKYYGLSPKEFKAQLSRSIV
ncbi:two-component regulator propeller domain-containing protein [Cellulophaga baltica]|uniref:two-component regulator propeller domain-containing protein n=1 Tax=Cellulophaga baltica TaxID=76594 RepID=UPI00041697D9|nr:two-component regulator propeller domain-containing protein [Cellulophaga baltica]